MGTNEYDLQSFHSYIKLASRIIIDIPKFDDNDYLQLIQSSKYADNTSYWHKKQNLFLNFDKNGKIIKFGVPTT